MNSVVSAYTRAAQSEVCEPTLAHNEVLVIKIKIRIILRTKTTKTQQMVRNEEW